MKKTLTLLSSALVLFFASCSNMKQENNSTVEKNKESVKKIFECFESGKTEDLGNYIDENAEDHTPDPMTKTKGLQGVKDAIMMEHTAFPDMKVKVLSIAAEGDMVYAHYNMSGKNTGAYGSMPATNKSMDVNGVDIVRFDNNGKAVEHWGYFEEAKMMKQLGMMPEHDMNADSTKMKDMKMEKK